MLRDLQRAIGAGLREDFKAAAPTGLVAGDPDRAAARFMIHRGNFVESLVNALGHTYPAIKAICGEHNFRVLAGTFVRAHPPRRPELMAYGGDFAEFAAGHAGATSDFPFLADLARLEWALHDAYFAGDAPALGPETLGAIEPERLPALVLTLHPAARIVASAQHPIHTIWAAAAQDGALPDPLPERGEAVLVARNSGPVEAFRLDTGEAVFLGAVAVGAPLEEALTQAALAAPGFDASAALAAALSRSVFGAEVAFTAASNGGEA